MTRPFYTVAIFVQPDKISRTVDQDTGAVSETCRFVLLNVALESVLGLISGKLKILLLTIVSALVTFGILFLRSPMSHLCLRKTTSDYRDNSVPP